MIPDDSLAFASIEQLSALLAKRKISAVELTRYFLRRIEEQNPRLNAYLTVTAELALRAAARAENQLRAARRSASGAPLMGIPFSLKDNIWTRGIRTTAGSKVLREFVPAQNATVVGRLQRAGAVLLGKTNLHEFAYGITSNNVHYGPVHNPWAQERIAGGSSGGSAAATAAGLCTISVGTDTGGSIRIPSALCGIVGLKPTFGRVSVHGTVPLVPSLDHVGPIARSVADAAILLRTIAGRDPLDSTSSRMRVEDYREALRVPLKKFRVGRSREYFWDKLDPEVRRLTEAALHDMQKRGAILSEVSLPHLHDSVEAATNMSLAETRYLHQAAGYYPAHAAEYGDEVRQRVEAGGAVSAVQYLDGREVQKRARAEFEAAFASVDVIVAPAVPVAAPPIGADFVMIDGEQVGVRPALVGMNRPGNFTGFPAISIPCGFTKAGLPVGLQLMGRAFDEATLLRIALSYERAHDWGSRHPPQA